MKKKKVKLERQWKEILRLALAKSSRLRGELKKRGEGNSQRGGIPFSSTDHEFQEREK